MIDCCVAILILGINISHEPSDPSLGKKTSDKQKIIFFLDKRCEGGVCVLPQTEASAKPENVATPSIKITK